MTDEELAAIAARADAAAVGPWQQYAADVGPVVLADGWIAVLSPKNAGRGWQEQIHNARFIARAREDVPKLVAEVRRLREECERLESLMAEYDELPE